ncbi:unnamed protein product [Pocillopora meandrina]|uniref:Uncharacterized protein n=1 Tax=Pocillopora meandrina TaxID=46732 RepID=A0AAU9Y2R3_9CNID|nr:unnamed protein product [Pocillopora meandrina]
MESRKKSTPYSSSSAKLYHRVFQGARIMANNNANEQDRFMGTDRDDLIDTFSQFLILDLEVPDDTPSMQTRMLAQVIFESQQMRSQGEMETIPVQPSWLMDSSVAMNFDRPIIRAQLDESNHKFPLCYHTWLIMDHNLFVFK